MCVNNTLNGIVFLHFLVPPVKRINKYYSRLVFFCLAVDTIPLYFISRSKYNTPYRVKNLTDWI